jgi:hypothetical protein
VELDGFLYGGDDIGDDLDFILFNPVASTTSKWRTFKLLRWMQRNPLITFELIGGLG